MKFFSGKLPSILGVLLLLISGCSASTPFMKNGALLETPNANEVLVTVVRPSSSNFTGNVAVWDSDHLVGVLKNAQYIQYKTTPGEHKYISQAKNFAFCKTNFLPGKHYVVVVFTWPNMGGTAPSAALNGMSHYMERTKMTDSSLSEATKKLLESCSSVIIESSAAAPYVTDNKATILAKLETFEKSKHTIIPADENIVIN